MSEKITGELLVRFSGRGGIDGVFAMADNQATGAIWGARKSASLAPRCRPRQEGVVVVVASNCMKDGIVQHQLGPAIQQPPPQIPTQEAEDQTRARRSRPYFGGEKLKKYEIVPVYGIAKENVAQFAAGCSY